MKNFKNKYLRYLIVNFTICLSSLFFIPHSFAASNLSVGRVLFDTEFAYAPQYNDNIYSAESNEESDFIHLFTPKINAIYTFKPENFLQATYQADIARYTDVENNNYEAHHPQVSAQLKTPSGLYLSVRDDYLKTADPYGDENEYALGIPQTKRWQNTFRLIAGYEFKKTMTLDCLYNHYQKEYDNLEDKWQNRSSNAFGAIFLYSTSPKASLLFQYMKTLARYDKQNDNILFSDGQSSWSSDTSQDFSLDEFYIGFRFAPMGKLTGEVKAGYGFHKFDNEFDPESKPYHDESGLIAAASLHYVMWERTSLILTVDRNFTPSPDTDANSYIGTSGFLKIIQGIGQQLNANMNIGITNLNYQNETQGLPGKALNIFQTKLGIGYRMNQYINSEVFYRFKTKKATDSTYNSEEYERNVVGFIVTLQY